MARGGGTGSRTKKKKDSAATANGPRESDGKKLANGPSEIDTQKHTNKTSKSRNKKRDEAELPVTNHTEDDATTSGPGREESQKPKLQPTSEQLRLAQITQMADQNQDPLRKAKISQVMDITGKTEDEVATALFDSAWDETKAIELLIEDGGLGSWEETGKKKKKKDKAEDRDKEGSNNKENFQDDWDTDNFDPNSNSKGGDSDARERSRARGPPRLRRGGGPASMGSRGQDDSWKNKEWSENEKNFEGGRGRGGRGMRSRGGGGGAPRSRGRGGGGGGGGRHPGGGRDFGPGQSDSGGFGSIDTWNPTGETSRPAGKMSNKDAFDNAGNWGDDFPAAEDWDNDEYTGSLSDTKVFTASGVNVGKSAVGEPVNGVQQQAGPAAGQRDSGATVANNSLSGNSYNQQIDLTALLAKPGVTPGGSSAAPGGPTGASLSHQYNQAATQDLKTAIGLGGGGPASSVAPGAGSGKGDLSGAYGGPSALNYSSGSSAPVYSSTSVSSNGSTFSASAAPSSAFSPIKPAAVTNGPAASKALPRARLPPPSKIPSSAVEMPGDSLATLDVQFGGLDLQFGAGSSDSSAAAAAAGGFDFTGGAGGPSAAAALAAAPTSKDIESKYPGSIPTSSADKQLDGYKPVSASVKDVTNSLTSALSAAGIKTAAGDGGYSSRSQDQKSAPGGFTGGAQGLQDRSKVSDTGSLSSYQSSSYSSYPSGQSSKSQQSQYGSSAGGPSNYSSQNSYDRQSASGYPSTNGGLSSNSSGYGGGYSGSAGGSAYGGQGGGGGSGASYSSSSNYNSAVTTYSSYGSATSNSYSNKSNNSGGGQYNSSAATTASNYGSASGAGGSGAGGADSSVPSTTGSSKYDSNSSVSGSSSYTANSGLLASTLTSTSSSSGGKSSSVNTTGSGKMMPNLPPGVTSVLPTQYMIGPNAAAAAAAGFPAYLAAAGLQQPMYGYGGHGLEGLAELQRNTLASLPQLPSTGYYDPSSQFPPTSLASRQDLPASSFANDSKFAGGVTDSTSSPVPSTVAAAGQPTPFNALAASTFTAAAPQPTLPPGYAYFYGGMAPTALQAAAYGGTGVYPAAHPAIPVPTAAGATATTQFQNKAYGSSYGTNYDSLGQSSSDYGKTNYGSQASQAAKTGSNSSSGGQHYWSSALW